MSRALTACRPNHQADFNRRDHPKFTRAPIHHPASAGRNRIKAEYERCRGCGRLASAADVGKSAVRLLNVCDE